MSYFSDVYIDLVWEKAHAIEGYDSTKWRQDFAGAWIQKDQYGIQSPLGWEIDHMVPRSHGGGDELVNLFPIHWRNNEAKGDKTPIFDTAISSEGNKNIERKQTWTIPSNLQQK